MKVLVTGGAGYVGSHAVRELLENGLDVVVYDNLSRGHRRLAQKCKLIEGDLGDAMRVRSALQGVEAVMHFAALAHVGESVQQPQKYFQNNVEAGLVFLNEVLDAGVRRFVFSSSCAVYGIPEKVPIGEESPRRPVNPYGVTKLFFEQALEAYDRAYGLRFASLRYFNAAGAHESGELGELHEPETHLIPNVLLAAAGVKKEVEIHGNDYPTPDGTCVRDYVHVCDLAHAHALALQALVAGGESMELNLGTGRGHSVEEVIRAAEEITGREIPRRHGPRRPGDPPVLVADPARAAKVLGWKPKRGLREIISTAWNWLPKGLPAGPA